MPDIYDFCVLLLDELPELGTRNLETLRQPLEDRVITISRASGSLTFPANFILVAAMNPCPCGYFQDSEKECTCSMSAVQRYQQRISTAAVLARMQEMSGHPSQ
jgi:magnesium chelatase family protein